MAQSKNYLKVKYYYDIKAWDIEKVKRAVVKGWITAKEFKEIAGEDYKE